MNAIRFGDPNLFVKGLIDVTITDPSTGNIIGYNKVLSDGAFTTSMNLGEVEGGLGNALAAIIPDTSRLSGTLTSQTFSMEHRALIAGGTISYDGISPVCEEITATGTSLSVSGNPVKDYGQAADDEYCRCYVRESGASSYLGTNYEIDATTKKVQNFTATSGTTYIVTYFANTNAKVLPLPANFTPSVASLRFKMPVYSMQGASVSQSNKVGTLWFIVPSAVFTGDAGLSANQTSNSTTDYAWQALSTDDNLPSCDACSTSNANYAYYVYVPCDGTGSLVEGLAVIGGEVEVAVSGTAQIPVKYVMADGSLAQPTYTDLTYVSGSTSTATVSASGVVTGVAEGDTDVTITYTKPDGTKLTTVCNVTVTA